MKGFLLLGDYATTHPDNTCTVVRGGVSIVHAERGAVPVGFFAGLLARVKGAPGEYALRLDVEAPDGAGTVQNLGGIEFPVAITITIPDSPTGEAAAQLVGPVRLALPTLGAYRIVLRVGEEVLDTWSFDLSPRPTLAPGYASPPSNASPDVGA